MAMDSSVQAIWVGTLTKWVIFPAVEGTFPKIRRLGARKRIVVGVLCAAVLLALQMGSGDLAVGRLITDTIAATLVAIGQHHIVKEIPSGRTNEAEERGSGEPAP